MPFAGAGALPQGAISASFRDRSFDLRVRTEGRVQRLHVPILLEEIEQQRCAVKKLAGKLVLTLAKPLMAGSYQVAWHVVSTDTHRIQGNLAFTVK